MSFLKTLPMWGAMARVARQAVAVALIGASGMASAGYVTFNEGVMDDIFKQSSFGLFTIDIRFNPSLSIVAPTLLDINSDAEFNGGINSLSGQASALGLPDSTVAIFFVDKISFCGSPGTSIIGCGNNPGNLIALNSASAAGANGAVLMAHELGHNLGLSHLDPAVSGNLMNPSITGGTTLTTDQVGSFVNLATGASLNSIVRNDGNGLYISITPIAVVAAVPEPHTWAMLMAGLLGVAGLARRRRACAAA